MRPLIGLTTYRETARWGVAHGGRPAAGVLRPVGRGRGRRTGAPAPAGGPRRGCPGGGGADPGARDLGRRGRGSASLRRGAGAPYDGVARGPGRLGDGTARRRRG